MFYYNDSMTYSSTYEVFYFISCCEFVFTYSIHDRNGFTRVELN